MERPIKSPPLEPRKQLNSPMISTLSSNSFARASHGKGIILNSNRSSSYCSQTSVVMRPSTLRSTLRPTFPRFSTSKMMPSLQKQRNSGSSPNSQLLKRPLIRSMKPLLDCWNTLLSRSFQSPMKPLRISSITTTSSKNAPCSLLFRIISNKPSENLTAGSLYQNLKRSSIGNAVLPNSTKPDT